MEMRPGMCIAGSKLGLPPLRPAHERRVTASLHGGEGPGVVGRAGGAGGAVAG